MRKDHPIPDNSKRAGRFGEDLPGSWYNYEASELTLDVQEFDHWLSQLEESLEFPAQRPLENHA